MVNRESAGCYRKIVIRGVVQGVGFRPMVYRLAREMEIRGTVQNTGGAVDILAEGTVENLSRFLYGIETYPLPHAQIQTLDTLSIPPFVADGFTIIESNSRPDEGVRFLSPDLAICPTCLAELEDPADKRYRHPFNTCVSCGPRFSVIEALPYDRENTSMAEFPLCAACRMEYTSPDNRRYHAETIACNDCGPQLLYCSQFDTCDRGEAFARATSELEDGGIIAIKGIGGYHFACSPFVEGAVDALRKLKGRDQKPFAVMFDSLETIKSVCAVGAAEEQLLISNPRPITLLRVKENPFADSVLLGDLRCGCFLPYTPLHHLLLRDRKMLIMTSANPSGSPILTDDGEMLAFLRKAAALAGVLYHKRRIVRGVEDSVIQCADGDRVQILRRSRGYVPQPIPIPNLKTCSLLAMGGDLKAAFCLVKGTYATMSPYFGDMEEAGVHDAYTAGIDDLQSLFNVEPTLIICDRHPGYHSSLYARRLVLPVMEVQHHHAHIASVMAEHGIDGPVLGVAFDGTGYGDDGAVWGGEFLVCEGVEYRRVTHLDYTKLQGGDSSSADAKKTATCFLHAAGIDGTAFDNRAGIIGSALEQDVGTVQSSSMGRLFDAVASILGICQENAYEGQCAILLQRNAELAQRQGAVPYPMAFDVTETNDGLSISCQSLIALLYRQSFQDANVNSGAFALGFHHAVAGMVTAVCQRLRELQSSDQVALSGGVFQNSLLLGLCLRQLEQAGFHCYFNQQVPSNDGGIALGQAYIGARR